MNTTQGKNLEDIQKMNRNLLIRLLVNGEITSRIALAKESNLKQATISNIISDFIDWGLVRETGLINNGIGRPIRGIRFCKECFWSISVRLSRNYIQTAVIDMAGNFCDPKQYLIDNKVELPIIIENLIVQIRKILKVYKDKYFLGISIAIPGPWISNHRKLAYFTGFTMWEDLDVGKTIEKKVGLQVFVEQDANIALMAESQFHSWTFNKQLVLLVMMGQGIGGAIYSNSEIMRGNLGIAGEIGHMSINSNGIPCECGNVGCLERYASTLTIVNNARSRIGSVLSVLTAKSTIDDIIEAYKNHDGLAVSCINEAAVYLGHALASLSNVLNPGVIIIGDELSAAGNFFLEEVKKAFNSRVTPAVQDSTEISLSSVKDNPYLLGGIQVVIEGCLTKPNFFAGIKKNKEHAV
jgi:predicted NBD/HSP70 family sugar kinase